MSIVFSSLTELELLRRARTSPLMDSPLFAEIVDRFELLTECGNLHELRAQQSQPYRNRALRTVVDLFDKR